LDRLMGRLEAAWGVIPADLRLQPVVVRGETGPALVDVANSGDDLLVVGAGRRGWLARIGHGRVTRYCVAHAVCPVVTVPPAALPGPASLVVPAPGTDPGPCARRVGGREAGPGPLVRTHWSR
jgi:hypothetical protein